MVIHLSEKYIGRKVGMGRRCCCWSDLFHSNVVVSESCVSVHDGYDEGRWYCNWAYRIGGALFNPSRLPLDGFLEIRCLQLVLTQFYDNVRYLVESNKIYIKVLVLSS